MLFTILICQFFSFSPLGSSFVLQLYFSTTDLTSSCTAFSLTKRHTAHPFGSFSFPHALSFYPSHFVATFEEILWSNNSALFVYLLLPHSQPVVKRKGLKLYLYITKSQKQSLKAEGKNYRGIFPLLAIGV